MLWGTTELSIPSYICACVLCSTYLLQVSKDSNPLFSDSSQSDDDEDAYKIIAMAQADYHFMAGMEQINSTVYKNSFGQRFVVSLCFVPATKWEVFDMRISSSFLSRKCA